MIEWYRIFIVHYDEIFETLCFMISYIGIECQWLINSHLIEWWELNSGCFNYVTPAKQEVCWFTLHFRTLFTMGCLISKNPWGLDKFIQQADSGSTLWRLVGGLVAINFMFPEILGFIFPSIGFLIIPTDFHIFQRAQPPTRFLLGNDSHQSPHGACDMTCMTWRATLNTRSPSVKWTKSQIAPFFAAQKVGWFVCCWVNWFMGVF